MNLIFSDGMLQWWSAMGVCFCEISSTLFASVGANQELLETLYEAVLSRIAAQLGFSELPTKKLFISYLNSAEIWYFEVYQSVLPVPQGSTDFPRYAGCLLVITVQGWTLQTVETSVMIIITLQILFLIVF